jgi:hypothetical protein
LMEEHVAGRTFMPPVEPLEIPAGRKKVIILFDHEYLKGYADYEFDEVRQAVADWLMYDGPNGCVLSLPGVKSINIYVEPEVKSSLTAEEIRQQLAEALRT